MAALLGHNHGRSSVTRPWPLFLFRAEAHDQASAFLLDMVPPSSCKRLCAFGTVWPKTPQLPALCPQSKRATNFGCVLAQVVGGDAPAPRRLHALAGEHARTRSHGRAHATHARDHAESAWTRTQGGA
eukprot:4019716-Pleurochrysis_carterae.AAC.5